MLHDVASFPCFVMRFVFRDEAGIAKPSSTLKGLTIKLTTSSNSLVLGLANSCKRRLIFHHSNTANTSVISVETASSIL